MKELLPQAELNEPASATLPASHALLPCAADTAQEADAAESLGCVLTEEARRQRRGLRRFMAASAAVCVLSASIGLVGVHLLGRERWAELVTSQAGVIGTAIAAAGLGLMVLLSLLGPHRKRWRATTQALASHDDLRSVGPLVDALALTDLGVRRSASESLTKLLPRMTADNADLLTAEQRAKLCRVLSLPIENTLYKDVRRLFLATPEEEVEFRISILKAFEQIGDASALPVVSKLADADGKTTGQKRLKASARACLPYLQTRHEQDRMRQTLLRPASPAQILLQPVEYGSEPHPERLLRPSAGEKPD